MPKIDNKRKSSAAVYSAVPHELGVDVPYSAYRAVDWPKFFRDCALQDVLDFAILCIGIIVLDEAASIAFCWIASNSANQRMNDAPTLTNERVAAVVLTSGVSSRAVSPG